MQIPGLVHLIFQVVVITSCGIASAAATTPDKTDEMVRLLSWHVAQARQFDGTYRAAAASKEAAWQVYQSAAAALGIKVTASATTFYSDRTEESRGVMGVSEVQRSFTGNQLYITAKKPLYRPREIAAIDQAHAHFQGADALLSSAENALFGRVFLAWIEILTARDLMHIARDALDRATVVRIEAERRFKAGDITIDQVGLEVSRQRQRQAEVVQAQLRQDVAERALCDLVGSDAVVPVSFTLESAVPNPIPHVSREQIFEYVEQRNPELIAARFSEQAARLERDKRDADHYPTVDIYATASKGENDTASYIRDEQRIGLQVSVPLYTSGALTAAVQQAEAEYRKMQALTHAAELRLKAQAGVAYATLQSALFKIEASKVHIEATGLRAEAIRRGLLAGTGTYSDLARAEAEFLMARQRRATEMMEFAQAWATLTVSTARIDAVFDQSLPSSSPPKSGPPQSTPRVDALQTVRGDR